MCIMYFRVNTHMYDNMNKLKWFGDNRVLVFLKEWE